MGFRKVGSDSDMPLYLAVDTLSEKDYESLPQDALIVTAEGVMYRETTPTYVSVVRAGDLKLKSLVRKIDKNLELRLPRIPRKVFARAVSFLADIERTCHSEARLDLFHREKDSRFMWVPPRQKVSAASISYVREQESFDPLGDGFAMIGSMHSHPGGLSAFASGTDSSDEDRNEGIHITVADLQSDCPSFDCRLVVNGLKKKINIVDLVDDGFDESYPSWWVDQVQARGD